MKRKQIYTLAFLLFLPLPLAFTTQVSNRIQITRSVNTFSAILKTLDQLYVDSLDLQHLSKVAIQAMLKEVDPYTEYYSKEERYKASLLTKGEYAGIGALLLERNGSFLVRQFYEGAPAAKAGLQIADIITAIEDKNVEGWTMEKVTNHLKGKPGEKVKIQVKRPGLKNPLTLEVEKEIVKMPVLPYYGMLDKGIGYLKLSTFSSEETADTFKKALLELLAQNPTSLMIDLRNNGGGRMEHAIRICSFFLPENSLVLTMRGKQPENMRVYHTSSSPIVPDDMPVVVLVNRSTASASEIVAGALQDYDRAVVLGEKSFGKGLVQTIANMPYGAQMKYTNAKYYIPSGRCIQARLYDHSQGGELQTTVLADSLLKPFKTKAGRTVYEGSGIIPDKEALFQLTIPESIAELERQNIFFDYATEYKVRHKKAPTLNGFELSRKDIADFESFIKKSSFAYENESERKLNDLLKESKEKGLYQQNKKAFDSLRKGLATNLHNDIVKNLEATKFRLSNEILSRYYGLSDMTAFQLQTDPQYHAARKLLADTATYRLMLTPPDK